MISVNDLNDKNQFDDLKIVIYSTVVKSVSQYYMQAKINSGMVSLLEQSLHFLKIGLLLYFLLGNQIIQAQSDSPNSKKWEFAAAPYLLFPNMSGDMTVKGIPVDADAKAADIFDSMDLGGMLYMEAYSEKWAIIIDGYFVNLSQKGITPLLERKV